ncbi:DUF6941 family protein [Chloroflexota bacterium]
MKVDFAFVCDYADAMGKINALGIGFDTIYSPKVPFKHPIFCVVLQLRAGAIEAGEKKLEIRLIDGDGKDIIPVLRKNIQMARSLIGADSVAKVALQFKNVQFPHYGPYSINAVLDGSEIASIPLNVNAPPKPLPGAQAPSSN